MNKPKINLLREKYKLDQNPRRPFLFFKRTFLVVVIFSVMAGAVFSYQISSSEDSHSLIKLPFVSTLKRLVKSEERMLSGEKEDRVNFLLMGIGGAGHDGPQLTDTIIFSSLKPSSNEIGLLSIPRDMIAEIPDYGWRKINHANAYGEQDNPGQGAAFASEVIGKTLDQKIHYYLRVDFSGFAQLIDDLEGVDIYVDQAFTDYDYPILGQEYAECDKPQIKTSVKEETSDLDNQDPEETTPPAPVNYDCRYETLVFEEGWEHMDGERALKYVRSRHGSNGEGSDFSRSARQQKVLVAVKEKVFSASTVLSPTKLTRILDTLSDNISTNLGTWELLRLASRVKNLETNNIKHQVLDSSEDSPLYATFLNGAYVLLPENDDWDLIHKMAAKIFYDESDSLAQVEETDSKVIPEKPKRVKIEIQNGTQITGLAFNTSQLLKLEGFNVVKIGNATQRSYKHTVIFDLSNGQKPNELNELRDYLEAEATLSEKGWVITGDVVPKELHLKADEYNTLATQENIDFLVILGESSANVVQK
ncbi:LCP family protein [Patescibacteria group bacterium]